MDILHPCLGGFVEEGDEEEQDVLELGEQVSQVNQAQNQLQRRKQIHLKDKGSLQKKNIWFI